MPKSSFSEVVLCCPLLADDATACEYKYELTLRVELMMALCNMQNSFTPNYNNNYYKYHYYYC